MSGSHSNEIQTKSGIVWVLWVTLAINAAMFAIDLTFGLLSKSNVLISDSLDMLADAFVYASSLLVLSSSHKVKARVSLLKGVVMGVLALYFLLEVVQKLYSPIVPEASIITYIGLVSLVANIACAILLLRFRGDDLNIRSAWVCSRNDALTSIGVIIAGLLVGYLNSMWPDIIIGLVIAVLVLSSSFGIIKESLAHVREHSD